MSARGKLFSTAARLLVIAALSAAVIPGVAAADTPAPPDYRYWFATATTKVYPTSLPPANAGYASSTTPSAMNLAAAIGEYEGRQIAIRSAVTTIQDFWIEPSDLSGVDASGNPLPPISASNVSTYKVGYVYIKYPSRGYTRKGWEPDPLIPMALANGEKLGWQDGAPALPSRRGVGRNATLPFYVLFHVPAETAPGTYTGTLKLSCTDPVGAPAPDVVIPVTLKVWPFSIEKRTLKTAFGMNLQWAAYTNSATHKWLAQGSATPTRVAERTTYKQDQLGGWLKFFADHRISPQSMLPAWDSGRDWAPPNDDGEMMARNDVLADYLATGPATTFAGNRFAFNATKLPEYGAPSYVTNPFTSSSAAASAAKYYGTMRTSLRSYLGQSYAYPVDEPRATARTFVERYATFVHRYAPGVKYLVTTDPVTMRYRLLRGVDLYGQKLQFYYRDWGAWIKKIRLAHHNVWIYSHATTWQGVTPAYLIDQPLAASRVQGWFAFNTRADGLIYFNVSAWRPKTGSSAFRDPYRDPLSYRSGSGRTAMYANGDGSLVYPGYYPAAGLVVQGAAPVGSLRMEAVRDGIEDYEYLRLVAAKRGWKTADWYANRVLGKLPAPRSGHLLFPPWSRTPGTYESVRSWMAADLCR